MHALETDDVLALARRVRALSPDVPIVDRRPYRGRLSGPFLSPTSAAVVLDDGERALPRVCDALERGAPLTTVPGLALPDGDGGILRTAGETGTLALDDVPLPARHHVAPWRRQYACLAHRPDLAGRDRARLPVPMLVLLDLAAARACGARAVDRRRLPRLRVGRRPRVRRRRSVLAPPVAEPGARARASAARRAQAVDSGAEPRRSGGAPPGAARGVAAARAGLRHLLRSRGGDRRGARRPDEGCHRRSRPRGASRSRATSTTASPATSSSIRRGANATSSVCGSSSSGTAVSGRLHDPDAAAGHRLFRRDAAAAARAPLVAFRHAPSALGAGARAGAFLRAVLRDLAAVGAEPEGAQAPLAVAARGRPAQRAGSCSGRSGGRSA